MPINIEVMVVVLVDTSQALSTNVLRHYALKVLRSQGMSEDSLAVFFM